MVRAEVVPAEVAASGVRHLHVTSERPVTVEVRLWDGVLDHVLRFAAPVRDERLPILGLPLATSVEAVVIATDDRGRVSVVGPLSFVTDALPERFPQVEVLASEPDRIEPGFVMLVVRSPAGGASPLVVFDRLARPVWAAELEPSFGGDVTRGPAGTFRGLSAGGWREVDVTGAEVRRIDLDGEPLHHEVVTAPDGTFWSLRGAAYEEPAYPVDPADPRGPSAPALLQDEEVVRFDADGAILSSWRLSEVLDTTRVSAQSFDPAGGGRLDWAHANAVLPTDDGGAIVSVRHQDAIVRFGPDGALRWILGDPGGWQAPWDALLLAPQGDLEWPYHAHAPALDPDGALVLYDNHNHGTTLYDPPLHETTFSRAVAFRIDEDDRTVSLAWQRTHTTTGRLWTPANGDVDLLPETGNLFVDFGFVTREELVENEEAGRGARAIRLVEYPADPDEPPVLDWRLSGDLAEEPEGWQAFRAERVPALYPAGWLEEGG